MSAPPQAGSGDPIPAKQLADELDRIYWYLAPGVDRRFVREAAERLREAVRQVAPAPPSEHVCRCGTVMICPDIGCDENKLPEAASASVAWEPQRIALLLESVRWQSHWCGGCGKTYLRCRVCQGVGPQRHRDECQATVQHACSVAGGCRAAAFTDQFIQPLPPAPSGGRKDDDASR